MGAAVVEQLVDVADLGLEREDGLEHVVVALAVERAADAAEARRVRAEQLPHALGPDELREERPRHPESDEEALSLKKRNLRRRNGRGCAGRGGARVTSNLSDSESAAQGSPGLGLHAASLVNGVSDEHGEQAEREHKADAVSSQRQLPA